MADDRIQQNSSDHSQHTWDEQQLAITDANQAREATSKAAVERAFKAASRAPATKNQTNSLDSGDFPIPFGVTSAAKPVRRSVGKKGK